MSNQSEYNFLTSAGDKTRRKSDDKSTTTAGKLLVFGNPIVDIIVKVDYDYLKKYNLQKGVVNFLPDQVLLEICDTDFMRKNAKYLPGGSAANTAQNISRLGYHVSFVGHIGDDKLAKIFTQSMQKSRISDRYLLTDNNTLTTQCYIFVTPDGDRTILPLTGASQNISQSDTSLELIKEHVGLFTDPYLLNYSKGVDLIKFAFNAGKKHGTQTCFTLADPSCVTKHRQTIWEFLPDIDLLVGNIREFEYLFEESDIQKLLHSLQLICHECTDADAEKKMFIITLDKYGSMFISKNRSIFVQINPFLPSEKVIDTTGAGDSFVSGFIFSYLTGKNIEDCLRLSTLMGSTAVQQFGGLISYPLIRRIKQAVSP